MPKQYLKQRTYLTFDTPDAKVNSLIAIAYNSNAPEHYNGWTMCGMLDLPQELKAAEEFCEV